MLNTCLIPVSLKPRLQETPSPQGNELGFILHSLGSSCQHSKSISSSTRITLLLCTFTLHCWPNGFKYFFLPDKGSIKTLFALFRAKNPKQTTTQKQDLGWSGSAIINSFKPDVCTEISVTMDQKYLRLALNTVRSTMCP